MFQFKQNDRILTLGEMDAIVASFWNKEVLPKEYAYPGEGTWYCHAPNWFDILGPAIENAQYFRTHNLDGTYTYHKAGYCHKPEFEMDKLISVILCNATVFPDDTNEVYDMLEFMKPYVELCFHLKELGIIGIGLGW